MWKSSPLLPVFGPRTREFRNVWMTVSEAASSADEETLSHLFHKLNLYPSKAQVFEMLHSSKVGSRGEKDRLSFGEFCFFATELRHCYANDTPSPLVHSRLPHPLNNLPHKRHSGRRSRHSVYDVFLGGSCNPTTWRHDLAVPQLKKLGITFYNPQVASWRPEFMELEHQAKMGASLLLFVIDNQTRAAASIIEASYLAALGRRLLLVITPYPERDHVVAGEHISKREYEDLLHGQVVLTDLVERQGLPIFKSVQDALDVVPQLLSSGDHPRNLSLSPQVVPVKMGYLTMGDKLMKLREAFDTLDTQRTGKLNMNELNMAFRILAHRNLDSQEVSNLTQSLSCPLSAVVSRESLPVGICENGASQRSLSESVCSTNIKTCATENQKLTTILDVHVELDFNMFCALVAEYYSYPEEDHEIQAPVTGRRIQRSLFRGSPAVGAMMRRFPLLGDLVGRATSALHMLSRPLQRAIGWTPNTLLITSSRPESFRRAAVPARDVYLGGSVGHTTWRSAIAIPMLKKRGLTFCNPISTRWSERLTPLEMATIDNSKLLLFVVGNSTRSLATMATAASYIAQSCNVILCIQKLPKDCIIDGEKLSECAIKDYNRGRSYLSDLANREGVPVFESVQESVDCVIRRCLSRRSS